MSEIKEQYKAIKIILDVIFAIVTLTALILLIIVIGFYLTNEQVEIIKNMMRATTIIFVFQECARWFIVKNRINYIRSRFIENILVVLILIQFILQHTTIGYLESLSSNYGIIDISFAYLAVSQVLVFIAFLVEILRHNNILSKTHLHPGAIPALSFATVITIGTLLLILPKASPTTSPMNFVDALFTAASATCITGLSTVNIVTDYTTLGRIIIICLVQIGGIGVMTLTSFFASLIFGGLSYRMNIMIKDIVSEDNLSEITNVLKKITIFTLSFELLGAISLYHSLGGSFLYPNIAKLKTAAFHAVSAFCNAGFSTLSDGLTNPIVQNNHLFLSTIMILIIFGGFGFFAFSNMFSYIFFKKHRYSLNKRRFTLSTHLAFTMTILLIFIGTISIFLLEDFHTETWMTTGDKLFHSLFISVTSRTAGFSTINTGELTHTSCFIITALMFIGASPGSTGGGIKTTTFAVIVLHFWAYIRGKDYVELYKRRINPTSVTKAHLVFVVYILVLLVLTPVITYYQPLMHFEDIILEAVSAISTTGLSTGITSKLATQSKIALIILMFIGRIGALSFFIALCPNKQELRYTVPEERVMIG